MKSYTRYWQNVLAILIVSGLMFFPRTAQAAGSIVYEQAPDHFGGVGSGNHVAVVADEFQLGQPTLVTNITWLGGYANVLGFSVPSVDNFTVLLYADNGGQPGALLQAFYVGNNALRTATGNWVNPPRPDPDDDEDGFPGRPEFEYSFNLPAVFLAEANTRYWLSIVNMLMDTGVDDDWVWETSASPLNPGIQRSFFDSGTWTPYEITTINTAFQLQGIETTASRVVNIDIRPGIFPNSINIDDTGTVPVAILSSPTFNAPSQVNKSRLTFGRTEAEHSYSSCSTTPADVNRDGLPDLVCRFKIQWAGFQLGDTVGILKGKIVGTEIYFVGVDSVSPFVPPELFP
jgi:hypothetical protein